MPGGIIGIYGPQRSGKTLIAYLTALHIFDFYKETYKKEIRIYSNLYIKENSDIRVTNVNSISELPLDLEPKIIILDEIYNGTDANDFRKLKDISIFINTVGKQNALLIYTSIDDSMVYNRIRNQCNLIMLVKKNDDLIFYRTIDPSSLAVNDYCVRKEPELFKRVHYDTNFIPLVFDWKMDNWQNKLRVFYEENYNINFSDDYFK